MQKKIYMMIMFLLSRMFMPFSHRTKIVFLSSFGDNSVPVANEIVRRQPEVKIVFLYEASAINALTMLDARIERKRCDGIAMLFCIATLLSARKLVIDNYFAVLAALPNSPKCETIQVWHANGAIKKFGLEDLSNEKRSDADKRRFQKVYNYTDSYVVSSKAMMTIFERSFAAVGKKSLPFGIPRTDILLNPVEMMLKREKIRKQYNISPEKKVIVYAPTYRSGSNKLILDIERLRRDHAATSVLLIKRHPRLNDTNTIETDDFVKVVPHTAALTDFYPAIDILISDYSSIPFEVSLLASVQQMLFFCYDAKEYAEEQGLQLGWRTMLPGEICETTEQLSAMISTKKNMDYTQYNKKWNTYTNGTAIQQLAAYLA